MCGAKLKSLIPLQGEFFSQRCRLAPNQRTSLKSDNRQQCTSPQLGVLVESQLHYLQFGVLGVNQIIGNMEFLGRGLDP